MICTFFGHRDAPSKIKPQLKSEILHAISMGVNEFYVGNNGGFDLLVQATLYELLNEGYNFKYNIVLSYVGERAMAGQQEFTIFPCGQESCLPKFAVAKRNKWLIQKSNIVIAYLRYKGTNTGKIVEMAKRRGLCIINVYK
ncbi:MAG: hypothetical protein J6C61_07615 [Clostridia bacterium]|nr:hypothetical protein [Clostridia bacterium]